MHIHIALSYVLSKTQTILSIKKLDVFVLLIEVSSMRLFAEKFPQTEYSSDHSECILWHLG